MENKESDFFKQAFRKKITDTAAPSERDGIIWENVSDQINSNGRKLPLTRTFWWYSAAAFTILSIGAGAFFYSSNNTQTSNIAQTEIVLDSFKYNSQTQRNDENSTSDNSAISEFSVNEVASIQFTNERIARQKPVEIALEDGTTISLLPHSLIKFPDLFSSNRNIWLEGNATFSVKSDKSHPFAVYFAERKLVVVGTKFTIKNNVLSHQSSVQVTEGKVQVFDKAGIPPVFLVKGQEMVFGKSVDKKMDSSKPLASSPSASQKISMDFENSVLVEVVDKVQMKYGVEINLSPEIKKCRFTGDLSEHSLDEALQIIAASSSLELRKEGKAYYLKGTGCD